jgi:signal peptide peptidase SppA
MKLIDILTSPWAIEPGKLIELQAIYMAHVHGEAIDIEAVEKRLGRPLANEQRGYQVADGVAVLPIEGVVAKKMNMFSQISGGTSSQLARQSLEQALNDPAVHSIVLAIDSPGGTVDGTQTFADAILAARGTKPIVTHASGTIGSAAYWFGSAADKVYLADATTAAGSVGVVTTHVDVSAAEAAKGVKTTELTAGKYKRIASQYAPLSAEGRQSIQDQLDYMYSLFVGAVAANRGVSTDKVLSDMADGRVFIGQQAVDAGLADGIMPLEALIAQLNQAQGAAHPAPTPPRAVPARATIPTPAQGNTMNKEELQAQHPALVIELRAEGAKAERERIQSIEAQSIAGHENLLATLKFDGKSTAGDAAMAILAAEKTARAAHASASAAEAPNPVPVVPAAAAAAAPEAPAEKSREELDRDAKAYMKANPGTTYVAAYKAVGGE